MTKSELKQKLESVIDDAAIENQNCVAENYDDHTWSFRHGADVLLPLLLDAYEALNAIDKALTIPAAEYVPAIGDVFKIIDSVRPRIEAFANGESK